MAGHGAPPIRGGVIEFERVRLSIFPSIPRNKFSDWMGSGVPRSPLHFEIRNVWFSCVLMSVDRFAWVSSGSGVCSDVANGCGPQVGTSRENRLPRAPRLPNNNLHYRLGS